MLHRREISGKQCAAFRAWAQIEQRELAEKLGVSRMAIQRFEGGVHRLRDGHLIKLAEVFLERGIEPLYDIAGYPEGIRLKRNQPYKPRAYVSAKHRKPSTSRVPQPAAAPAPSLAEQLAALEAKLVAAEEPQADGDDDDRKYDF